MTFPLSLSACLLVSSLFRSYLESPSDETSWCGFPDILGNTVTAEFLFPRLSQPFHPFSLDGLRFGAGIVLEIHHLGLDTTELLVPLHFDLLKFSAMVSVAEFLSVIKARPCLKVPPIARRGSAQAFNLSRGK